MDGARGDREGRRIADGVRQQASDRESEGNADDHCGADGARGAPAVQRPASVERERLRGHEHARRAGAVEQASREEEHPDVPGDDSECEESPRTTALNPEADEQGPGTSAVAVREHADDRRRHDAHRAIRREDHADERER